MEPSRRPLPPPSFIPLPHRCPGPPPHLCGSRPSGPACPGGCFYTALPPAVGDEETDNEKLRGGQGGGRGQPRLSPDPRTVSHQPSSQGSLLPSQTAHRSRGLPYPRKHPGHTQRTHGTHGIDTGTRHRLSNTDQARDLTCALPDSAQLGPWARVKSHAQDRTVRSGHLGAVGTRPELGGQQLSQGWPPVSPRTPAHPSGLPPAGRPP